MAQQAIKHTGTCLWFHKSFGYGFIERKGQCNVYFRAEDIKGNCQIKKGTHVEFEIIYLKNSKHKMKAINVRTADKFSYWRNPNKNKPKYRNTNVANQKSSQTQEKQLTEPPVHEQNIQNDIENDTKVAETEELDEPTAKQLSDVIERALVLYRGEDGNNQLPEPNTGQAFVYNWLLNVFKENRQHGQNYFVKLVYEGFDDMECVTGMSDKDLEEIGVKKGHRRKILTACEAYKKLKNH